MAKISYIDYEVGTKGDRVAIFLSNMPTIEDFPISMPPSVARQVARQLLAAADMLDPPAPEVKK